jgi:ornithine cyclodeaminase
MADAWHAVRAIRRVQIWNHRPARAEALAEALRSEGFDALPATDLQAAVGEADIVSCATLSTVPLIQSAWLRPGTHLDLVGGFKPNMREVDDTSLLRARVFIDTPAALAEAGDLTQPIAAGVFSADQIAGTLAELCRGQIQGRRSEDEITLFKSVGTALEDLAAALLVYQDAQR